jgi:hypothetical protein
VESCRRASGAAGACVLSQSGDGSSRAAHRTADLSRPHRQRGRRSEAGICASGGFSVAVRRTERCAGPPSSRGRAFSKAGPQVAAGSSVEGDRALLGGAGLE